MNQVGEVVLAAFKAALFFALGSVDLRIAYLILMVGVDTSLGIFVAVKSSAFKVNSFFSKLGGKVVLYLLAIIAFNAFDQVAGLPGTAKMLCMMALAGLELISSLKNIASLGYPDVAKALEKAYEDIFRNTDTNVTPINKTLPPADNINIPTESGR